MKKSVIVVSVLGLLFLAGSPLLGQPSKLYATGNPTEPGSQLLYFLDTGVDAEELFGDDPSYEAQSVGDFGVTAPEFQSFISVTNVNPTNAVTVHFRYFNSDCEDVLDFLVLLSCNDTMLVDPFDYEIPGGGGVTTGDRFFGSISGLPVPAIPANEFGNGRFLLFVTASGDPTDEDNIADKLFQYEMIERDDDDEIDDARADDCENINDDTVGADDGVRDDNLHILNSSAVAFNFLTGFWSTAVGPEAAAYGVRALARPAVDLEIDYLNDKFLSSPTYYESHGYGDGDPIDVPQFAVLSGTERILVDTVSPSSEYVWNTYYLRHEAHGGNQSWSDPDMEVPADSDTFPGTGVASEMGAMEWTLFPIEGEVDGIAPEDQLVQLASLLDDYNGSNNIEGLAFQDYSYRMDPVTTIYNIIVYDNNEVAVDVPTPPVIISPPPEGEELKLVIAVQCLNAWTVGSECTNEPSNNLGDFSIEDLFAIGGSRVIDHLLTPVDVNDELGPGWVKFNRAITTTVTEFVNEDDECEAEILSYDGQLPTIVTAGQNVIRFEGFGASWWLTSVEDELYQKYIDTN
jgi:hypothetical protein